MHGKSLARETAVIGLLIALQIILTRFFIQTPYIRIDFAFVPIAFCAMLYGPLKAGGAAAAGDVLGFALFPPPFPFFPGFTLTAFLTGVIYGVFLYRKPKSLARFAVPVIVISLFVNLGLDTLWLVIMSVGSFSNLFVMFPDQLIQALGVIMPFRFFRMLLVPLQITLLALLWKYVMLQLGSRFIPSISRE